MGRRLVMWVMWAVWVSALSACGLGRFRASISNAAAAVSLPAGLDVGSSDAPPTALPLHRLNRLEYQNTVRDLFGANLAPVNSFPVDLTTDGFDNNAAGLSLSPALFGLYNQAASQIADAALRARPAFSAEIAAQTLEHTEVAVSDWGALITQTVSANFTTPQDDELTLSIASTCQILGVVPVPSLTLRVDGQAVKSWPVTGVF
ncbi:MAG: DUF1587 domain-containing protein, partial [Deltaproteobacteria bacterium]